LPALIGNLDTGELVIVMLVAVLIFGRRLPEVASQAGRQIVKLRRSLDSAWRDTGMEREIREVRRNIQEAIPRDLSIGEMARLASAEMDKRVRANEEAARAALPEAQRDTPVAGDPSSAAPAALDPIAAGEIAVDPIARGPASETPAKPTVG